MPYLMKLMTKPMYKNSLMTCESQSDKDEKDQVDVSQTYCANYMVPDSAATASAMYSGVKTTFFTMGYNSRYSFYTTAKRLNGRPKMLQPLSACRSELDLI